LYFVPGPVTTDQTTHFISNKRSEINVKVIFLITNFNGKLKVQNAG
jgi:hypothetical protein